MSTQELCDMMSHEFEDGSCNTCGYQCTHERGYIEDDDVNVCITCGKPFEANEDWPTS